MILQNIPNALTVFRLTLIFPFVLYFFDQKYIEAFYVFILAGLTDCLDGWLARMFHWQSFFGFFVDPMADKLLVAVSFISLAIVGCLPWWLVILVFLRDLTISIGVLAWYGLFRRKLDLRPTLLSKCNTALQLLLVTLCLFELAYFKFSSSLMDSLIYLTAITTSITYLHYLWVGCHKAWPQKEWIR